LWRAFFVVGIYSGCRPGELVGADWNDICGSTLTIRAGAARVNGQTVRTQKPKTRASERKIDLPPVVLDILTMWHTEQMLHASAIGEPQPEAVFTQYDGRRIDLSSPTRRFQKIIKRYNLPPLTLYGLRHSAASLLISQGLDVRTVAARLGHSQTATTLNVYSHAFESANSRATQAITDAIEAARKNRKTDDLTPNSPQEE
jgi:integrase